MNIFLIGAGASAWYGLPLSKGFFRRFAPREANLFRWLVDKFGDGKAESLDAELALEFLQSLSNETNEQTGKTIRLVKTRHLQHLVPSQYNKEVLNEWMQRAGELFEYIRKSSAALTQEIHSHLFDALNLQSNNLADDPYLQLFASSATKFRSIPIFTTNYDLILEDIFESIGSDDREWKATGINDVNFGFQPTKTRWEFEPSRVSLLEGHANVFKLHGSLDWDRYGDRYIRTGSPRAPRDPAHPLIVFPGFKELPSEEPFMSFHRLFQDSLERSAENLIAVGFSFRDSYLNTIVASSLRMNRKLRVACVTPELPKESGFPTLIQDYGERCKHIPGKFGEDDLSVLLKDVLN